MVFPRCRSSQNSRAHREGHRLQRRSPAGRHHALRKRAEGLALFHLRSWPLLRQTRKRRPPFPYALKRIPRWRRNRKPEGLATESQSTQRTEMNDHAELAQKFIDSFEAVAVNLQFFEHLDP